MTLTFKKINECAAVFILFAAKNCEMRIAERVFVKFDIKEFY
jgi:hypothetical protein